MLDAIASGDVNRMSAVLDQVTVAHLDRTARPSWILGDSGGTWLRVDVDENTIRRARRAGAASSWPAQQACRSLRLLASWAASDAEDSPGVSGPRGSQSRLSESNRRPSHYE